MGLFEFPRVLLRAKIRVYHQHAPAKPGDRYAVWQEYHARRKPGTPLVVRSIQVDFYSREELDPALEWILREFDAAGVFYEEPETSYDPETGYTRNMIDCQIIDAR